MGFAKTKRGVHKARLDVPLYKTTQGDVVGVAIEQRGANATDALHRVSDKALAILAFWGAPDDVMFRLHAISHILSGQDEQDFEELTGCGYDEAGDFVGALAKTR